MFNKNNKNNKGFSLVELTMVISILSILFLVGFFNFRNTQTLTQIKNSQRELVAAIRIAQSYAIQGRTQLIGGKDEVPCGYGVRFISQNEYEIFYNEPPTGEWKSCETIDSNPDYRKYVSSESIALNNFNFKGDVRLSSPAVSESGIYFSVPNATLYNYEGNAANNINFILKLNETEKTITIRSTGSISEN